jgi:hypothetical protein
VEPQDAPGGGGSDAPSGSGSSATSDGGGDGLSGNLKTGAIAAGAVLIALFGLRRLMRRG